MVAQNPLGDGPVWISERRESPLCKVGGTGVPSGDSHNPVVGGTEPEVEVAEGAEPECSVEHVNADSWCSLQGAGVRPSATDPLRQRIAADTFLDSRAPEMGQRAGDAIPRDASEPESISATSSTSVALPDSGGVLGMGAAIEAIVAPSSAVDSAALVNSVRDAVVQFEVDVLVAVSQWVEQHPPPTVVVREVPVLPAAAIQAALGAFYADALAALGDHMERRSATAQGAAAVLRRVALEHDIERARRIPLPRLSREQFEEGNGRRSQRWDKRR